LRRGKLARDDLAEDAVLGHGRRTLSGQPPREREALLAGAEHAGELGLAQLLEQPPDLRAGADAKLANEVIAADQRRGSAAALVPVECAGQDLAGEVEVLVDRLLGLAAARGEAVGDREQRDVGG